MVTSWEVPHDIAMVPMVPVVRVQAGALLPCSLSDASMQAACMVWADGLRQHDVYHSSRGMVTIPYMLL